MSKIENYFTNDYIYIPYKKSNKVFVKDGNYVYKNDLIIENNKKIYSTVSGKVLGITELNNRKYIVIENDYKDKTKKRVYSKKNISDISKEDFINIINELNILDNFDFTSKVLIINGIDKYNEEITYNTLIKEYTDIILETIDALISILGIKKCYFAISNSDIDTVNTVINNIGTYPKIDLKLFTNNNIIGIKEVLINKLTNIKTKKYNSEYLNLIDIINIYNGLKKRIPITTTFITLNDKLNNKMKVLHINIGTNVKDILKEYNIKDEVTINGLISGINLKDKNFIIDKNFRSIFISNIKEYAELECINCGKCIQVCPVQINPKYMHFNKDNKSKNYKEKCVNCGMCEYVCPSKINLTKGI